MENIRILITDDHPIVREGLRALISIQRDMEVVGEAVDGREAVEMARELSPDVVLLDLLMPGVDGITAIPEILRELPGTRILVLTSYAEDDRIISAIKAGALGYLLKDSAPSELLAAIRDVFRGESPLPPSVARKVISELNRPAPKTEPEKEPLSEREREVLVLVARGMSNCEIARALVISERTVHTHVSRILHKLDVPSRTQAALYAVRKGVIELDCA